MGQFTTENITLPEGGSFVWKEGKYQETTYIKAGAFINDAAREADSRLVSPTLDLTTATTATLTFDHAYNHYKKADNHESELTLEVKEENGDWTPIVIPNFNDGSTWTYVSNTIDLSAYAGKKMQFAFHYKSTTTNALGWQITKVKVVANGEGGGTVDPEPEPEPGNADLFISEYVEGSSNNKYIEIYNPTNETIDLSSYSLDLNTNGGESWSKDGGGFSSYSELSGTIGAKSTIVYKHAEAAIFEGEATTCGAANFNGNDPVGLFKNGTLIDIVGKFANGSADFAKDVTLRRKSNVTSPSSTYDASQWETLSKDDVSGLGSHTMD